MANEIQDAATLLRSAAALIQSATRDWRPSAPTNNTKPFVEAMWGVRPPVYFHGREAQTLGLLIDRGEQGVTSGEASPLGWARRTSSYIAKLREAGVPIETVMEDAAEGVRVGRYILRTSITLLRREAC